jgi:acyl-coenzyme A thioesterase PaaI-like protein
VPEASHLDRRRVARHQRRPVTEEPAAAGGIVDGHGPDAAHPPGPELRRLADAVRTVIDQTVRTDASPAVLAQAAAAVEQAAALLEPLSPSWEASVPAMPSVQASPHDYFPFSPMIGRYSPLAPPVECEIVDGTVHGTVTLGAPYEGPPGCVHGGVIAGLFDEVLGIANILAGVGAMTGTLTIVYRSPTPLLTELRMVGVTEKIDGRKVHTKGTLHVGDRLCAEAEGVFIQVQRERFVSHAAAHGAGEPGGAT